MTRRAEAIVGIINLIDKNLESLNAQLKLLDIKEGMNTVLENVLNRNSSMIGHFYKITQEEPPADNIEELMENMKKDISFLTQLKEDMESRYKGILQEDLQKVNWVGITPEQFERWSR